MSIFTDYNKSVDRRRKLEGDIDYDREAVILETVELMTKNVADTIAFLDNDCTEEQFIWLSEVFDKIAERTGSKELVEALGRMDTGWFQEVPIFEGKTFWEVEEEVAWLDESTPWRKGENTDPSCSRT